MPVRPATKGGEGNGGQKRSSTARTDIIRTAYAEFARHGLSGSSVNAIAARTRTSKPMIYYYFGSKEGLYTAVIEEAYGRIRDVEQGLDLDALPPRDAMRRLIEATFDYHADNPDFVRLISVENIHNADHIAGSTTLAPRNAAVVEMMGKLLDCGARDGVFRAGMDPVEIHLMISGLCFHPVSNRHSWRVLFGVDLQAPDMLTRRRRHVVDTVLRFLRPD